MCYYINRKIKGDYMIKRRIFNKIDKPLLVITIICLIFGVFMVGSASSLKAYMSKANSYYYFARQLFFIAVGSARAVFLRKKRKK